MSTSTFTGVSFFLSFSSETKLSLLPCASAAFLRSSWILRNNPSMSSAPSGAGAAPPPAIASSYTSSGSGSENLENLVSSSSGYSTLVITRIIVSCDNGIASIISGISSASKPNSYAACCIISRNRSFAFSVPYASSLSLIWRSARSSLVSVQRIWLSFTFSIFILHHAFPYSESQASSQTFMRNSRITSFIRKTL